MFYCLIFTRATCCSRQFRELKGNCKQEVMQQAKIPKPNAAWAPVIARKCPLDWREFGEVGIITQMWLVEW
jgi:hypothetical protein